MEALLARVEPVATCPLCGGSTFRTVYEHADQIKYYSWDVGPHVFNVAQCVQCTLVMTAPRPAADDLVAAYRRSQNNYESEHWLTHYAMPVARQAVRAVGRLRRAEPVRLLDVGCGDGSFLKAMADRGWECLGVDVDEVAISYAARKGVRVLNVPFELLEVPENHFDLITFWHVLEHLFNPLDALRKAYGLVAPGGAVVAAVPNIASWQARFFGPHWFCLQTPYHLYHFSPRTLAAFCRRAGFEVVEVFPALELHSTGGIRLSAGGRANTAKHQRAFLARAFYVLLYRIARPLAALENAVSMGGSVAIIARKAA